MLTQMLSIATGQGNFGYPHAFWKRSLSGLLLTPMTLFWSLYGEACLLRGEYVKLEEHYNAHPVIRYYLAWSQFVRGQFCAALESCDWVLARVSQHWESIFLKSDVLAAEGRKDEVFCILGAVLHRKKTWIKLANIVDSYKELDRVQALFDHAVELGKVRSDDATVLENLAMAAQRCGNYKNAIAIWEHMEENQIVPHANNKFYLNMQFARDALAALLEVGERNGYKIFLISGTLLGFLRAGQFLPYDTDLDTGIFEMCSSDELQRVIWSAGCFFIMPSRCPHCIRIRHINGTPIDIFTHYKDNGDYWHSGVKVSWHNSPFTLREANFYGLRVFIPDPPEQYLLENYGINWKIPKVKFDSAIDCPNYRIANNDEFYIDKIRKRLQNMNSHKN